MKFPARKECEARVSTKSVKQESAFKSALQNAACFLITCAMVSHAHLSTCTNRTRVLVGKESSKLGLHGGFEA